MKKIIAVALSLTFALLALAVLPPFTSAHRDVNRKALAAVRVPINQSRHLDFSVSAQGEATAANSANYYTLEVSNISASPTAPDSGYLDGVCSGVNKWRANGVMQAQVNLITRFQYDNFQSVRRVGLSSTARGYDGWWASYQGFNWGPGGQSWLTSYVDANFTTGNLFMLLSIDEEVDSEGTCSVELH